MSQRDRPPDDLDPEDEEDYDEEESVFEDEADPEGPVLYGPDERDRDLIDGTWERRYYSGKARQFNWEALYPWFGLLVILSLVIPLILVAR